MTERKKTHTQNCLFLFYRKTCHPYTFTRLFSNKNVVHFEPHRRSRYFCVLGCIRRMHPKQPNWNVGAKTTKCVRWLCPVPNDKRCILLPCVWVYRFALWLLDISINSSIEKKCNHFFSFPFFLSFFIFFTLCCVSCMCFFPPFFLHWNRVCSCCVCVSVCKVYCGVFISNKKPTHRIHIPCKNKITTTRATLFSLRLGFDVRVVFFCTSSTDFFAYRCSKF